jgi:hypothetical protein
VNYHLKIWWYGCQGIFTILRAPFGHQIDIGTEIFRVKEGLLAAIAALPDVMGHSRHYFSRYSGHGWMIAFSGSMSVEYTFPGNPPGRRVAGAEGSARC